jgi:hypothetical protein
MSVLEIAVVVLMAVGIGLLSWAAARFPIEYEKAH